MNFKKKEGVRFASVLFLTVSHCFNSVTWVFLSSSEWETDLWICFWLWALRLQVLVGAKFTHLVLYLRHNLPFRWLQRSWICALVLPPSVCKWRFSPDWFLTSLAPNWRFQLGQSETLHAGLEWAFCRKVRRRGSDFSFYWCCFRSRKGFFFLLASKLLCKCTRQVGWNAKCLFQFVFIFCFQKRRRSSYGIGFGHNVIVFGSGNIFGEHCKMWRSRMLATVRLLLKCFDIFFWRCVSKVTAESLQWKELSLVLSDS